MDKELKSILLLVCILSTHGFSLRRRSNPYGLSNALDYLDRERRRIGDQEYYQEILANQDNVYPYDDLGGYVNYRDAYDSPSRYTIADLLDAYPGLSFQDKEGSAPSEKRSSRTTNPSLAELEAIFGPSNEAQERSKKRDTSLSTRSLQNKESEKNSNAEKETAETDTAPAKDDSSVQISQSEMKKLLKEAEKVDKEAVAQDVEENEAAAVETEPVTKEELETVFTEKSDDKETEVDGNTDTAKDATAAENENSNDQQTDQHDDGEFDSNRFWQLNGYLNLAPGSKKKRLAKRNFIDKSNAEKTMVDLANEVEALRDEVARLKLVEFLEDKENDFLANALKDATLAQLQGTDLHLKGEYGDIEEAIRVEEMLQAVKTNQQDEEDGELDTDAEPEVPSGVISPTEQEEAAVEPNILPVRTFEEAKKRTDEVQVPSLEDNMGRWYERPLRGQPMNKDEAEEVLDTLIHNYGHASDSEIDGQGLDLPIKDEDEADMRGLTPSEEKLLYEIETTNTGNSEEICPEVQEFNDNCVIADAVDLHIDDEARRLCNRHQTCYICGSTLGFSMSMCDGGFRGDIIALCGDDSQCIIEGAKFLSFIKGYHRFNFDYTKQCDVSCISDYIVGL